MSDEKEIKKNWAAVKKKKTVKQLLSKKKIRNLEYHDGQYIRIKIHDYMGYENYMVDLRNN